MHRRLPTNISATPDGYLVRVVRQNVRWQAFVSYSREDALLHAIGLRDRFIQRAGEVLKRHTKGSSNTGVPGISETVHWRRNRPISCFLVYLGKDQHPQNKRFYFGEFRPRQNAWQAAVRMRRAVGAIIPQDRAAAPSLLGMDTEVFCG